MARPKGLNPHPPEFERFLYAPVGEDRNGTVVTVLSTLARLGLDPWSEAAELALLPPEGARARLETLLARFRDVPALESDRGRVARDLSTLLPQSPRPQATRRAGASTTDGRPGASAGIWAALAIVLVLLQMVMVGGSGSGE
ncbi:hypothetical protein [uncultured Albimonas sp.]|uniref:hypothetical protein n=1 Tax=uncultured Albimonas sp. TaxID=1331701 RepID=UPI0030EE69F0|tara:strand:+ start:1587 stop:2012 length:426 start_codon:yes stop_codon:yes gene_type:complete